MIKKYRIKKSMLIALVVVILVGAAGGYYYNSTKAKASAATPALQTTVARQGDLTITASGTGTVIASYQVSLGFDDSGILSELNVKVGDKVKKGDVLGRIKTQHTEAEITADIASAQSAVIEAENNLADLEADAATNKANAMSNVATYAQAVRDAQYQLDNYTAPASIANMDPIEAIEYTSKLLDEARAAFEPYRYKASSNETRKALLQKYTDAQSLYDSALTRMEYEYELEIANAGLTKARADYAKYENGVSEKDRALAEANLEAANAKLESAKQTNAYEELVAPEDGTVIAIDYNVGESVGEEPMITLANIEQPILEIYLDESDMENIKVGYAVEVTFDAIPDRVFTGKVTQVNPSLEEVSGVQAIKAEVQLDALAEGDETITGLPTGLSASVDVIVAEAKDTVLVAADALKQIDADEYVVFVQENGEWVVRTVKVGLKDVASVQILEGLKAGEIVSLGVTGITQ